MTILLIPAMLFGGFVGACILLVPRFAYYFIVQERPYRVAERKYNIFQEFRNTLKAQEFLGGIKLESSWLWHSENGRAGLSITGYLPYSPVTLMLRSAPPSTGTSAHMREVVLLECTISQDTDIEAVVKMFVDSANIWLALLTDDEVAWQAMSKFEQAGMSRATGSILLDFVSERIGN